MFTDSRDGTISDSQSGLMWQQGENADKMDYESAIGFCENLDLASHDDWRLPTKEELLSLAAAGGDLLHEHFPGLEQERYWALSSSNELSWAESPDRIAYTVDFDPESGNYRQPTTYFRTYEYYVRAVRLGTEEETILTDEAESGAVVEHAESLQTLTGHSDAVTACAVSPDGTWIVSASKDRTLKV